jgi:hypothetical protein
VIDDALPSKKNVSALEEAEFEEEEGDSFAKHSMLQCKLAFSPCTIGLADEQHSTRCGRTAPGSWSTVKLVWAKHG